MPHEVEDLPEYMKDHAERLARWKAGQNARMPMPNVPKIAPDRNAMMPMRDGTRLYTEIFFPKDIDGPYPIILVRTPYPDTTMAFSSRPIELFRKAGYATVIQSCRGTWKSEGTFRFFQNEPEDGFDCIEWLARQDFSNGKVGMYGSSYSGSVQWLAARMSPPHLTCIAPQSPGAMFFNETPYMGGVLFKLHWLTWPHLVAKHRWEDMDFEWMALSPAPDSLIYNALRQSPNIDALRDWNADHPELISAMLEPLEHPTMDAWWDNIMLTADTVKAVDIPVFAITGFHDGDQAGCLYNWEMIEAHENETAAKRHLLVGPWRHAQMATGKTAPMGHVEFNQNADVSLPAEILSFFDAYMKDDTAAAAKLPKRCRLYSTGTNKWREVSNYPLRETTETSLFLSSNGNANSLFGDGRLSFERARGHHPDRMPSDWENPAPIVLIGEDARDNETRHDVLVYTTAPLTNDQTVLGPIMAEIFMAVDAPDADIILRIEDVQPDGKAINMTGEAGMAPFRARYRDGFDKEVLLTPNEPAMLRFHICHMGHTFKRGHSIRLSIVATASNVLEANHHTGEPVLTAVERRKAVQTVFHDPERPSRIVLPILEESGDAK